MVVIKMRTKGKKTMRGRRKIFSVHEEEGVRGEAAKARLASKLMSPAPTLCTRQKDKPTALQSHETH